jgi:hypothetical protein
VDQGSNAEENQRSAEKASIPTKSFSAISAQILPAAATEFQKMRIKSGGLKFSQILK